MASVGEDAGFESSSAKFSSALRTRGSDEEFFWILKADRLLEHFQDGEVIRW